MVKIKAVYLEFTSFEGSLFRYSLSFSLLLAIAPSLILFAMLFKYAYISEDLVMDFIVKFLPITDVDTVNQVLMYFTSKDYNSIISVIVTICTSFYLASRSIYSFLLISASHEEVDVPKWVIRVKSIAMFIVMTGLLVGSIYIATKFLAFLPFVASGIMLLLFFMMYRALSFRKRNVTFGLVGAMLTTVCILGLAALFVNIIDYFTSYETIYGPLASLVTLLLAIYLISCIIYLGFCLNIVIEDDYGIEKDLPLKNPKAIAWSNTLVDNVKERLKKHRKFRGKS